MTTVARILEVVLLSTTLAACGAFAKRSDIDEQRQLAEIAREVSESARRVAVSKPGAKVCRQLRVGISELDWIRGTAIEVESDRIRIRIDEPGRFSNVLDGTTIARGVSIWDAQVNWTPCR